MGQRELWGESSSSWKQDPEEVHTVFPLLGPGLISFLVPYVLLLELHLEVSCCHLSKTLSYQSLGCH